MDILKMMILNSINNDDDPKTKFHIKNVFMVLT